MLNIALGLTTLIIILNIILVTIPDLYLIHYYCSYGKKKIEVGLEAHMGVVMFKRGPVWSLVIWKTKGADVNKE